MWIFSNSKLGISWIAVHVGIQVEGIVVFVEHIGGEIKCVFSWELILPDTGTVGLIGLKIIQVAAILFFLLIESAETGTHNAVEAA